MAEISPIPQPPTVPFLGNARLIDSHVPLHSFELLARQYGEIYKLVLTGGKSLVAVNSHALTRQVSDDTRFKKSIGATLKQVRNLAGDGLFTAYGMEPNWGIAHRLLMPAFSTLNVRTMYEGMLDICDQLLLKWERFGSETPIDPAEDFTRLTFDTIALCSMSHRFNSFYSMDLPKFIQEMTDFLTESNSRAYRPGILQSLPLFGSGTYDEDIRYMKEAARDIIRNRREHPTEKRDLLSVMLGSKDPVTGEFLSEDAIVKNLLTFLIAGHETTSGMLTFATYFLLKNPDKLRKLREELDEKLGPDDGDEISLEQLGECEYLVAIMRETLRLAPTATARGVEPIEDAIIIGGDGDPSNLANKRYLVQKGQSIAVQEYIQMRDPRVWGEDADSFRPERMMGGAFEKLPPAAWQPFGFGARACIGRPFAWQEAQLVLASIFRRFDISFTDPSYNLVIKQALTIKPKDMHIRVKLRPASAAAADAAASRRRKHSKITLGGTDAAVTTKEKSTASGGQKMYVLYGSNTGTCEAFSQRVATDAHAHGFQATLATLDSSVSQLPTDGPVVIITASFEGEPADNAVHFVHWLESSTSDSALLKGVQYTVFGCGNREWAHTYQRIPTLIDDALASCGATRLFERGEGDAGAANFFSVFDAYEAKMWEVLAKSFGTSASQDAEVSPFNVEVLDAGTARAKLLRQPDADMAQIVENRLLTKPGTPEKRHIKIKLSDGVTYRAGDYLAILPTNPVEIVKRVLAHFGLSPEEQLSIKSQGPTTFPVDKPCTVFSILSGFVELSQPASTRDVSILLEHSTKEETKAYLSKAAETHQESILAKRISVIDILEDHKDINLPFSTYLQMVPPMRVRQYSISSSPLAHPGHLSLTVSILEAPALSGHVTHTGDALKFYGVASTFLARLAPGDRLAVVVRPSNAAFHLPNDPSVPVIMFCAGSGLAPFRAFVEERAAQKASGRDVGKMILFFGCRAPDVDYLYSETDLKAWVESGVVDVRPAFSRSEHPACAGCKYVQDRVIKDSQDISLLYDAGAKFYTCGSRKVANGIKDACVKNIKQARPAYSEDDATAAFERVQKERYASDVFD